MFHVEHLALDLLSACVFHVEHLWITSLSPASWALLPFVRLARFVRRAPPTRPKRKQAHPIFEPESAADQG